MGPLTKEPPESAKATLDSAHADLSASQGAHAASIDAFGIEIPVRLQGSQSGAGAFGAANSYQEDTCTLIVFPQGAVLRSSTNLAAGQHLLLKNQKTNQEIPCRVVNLRSYSTGYVEIEFDRPAPGFWGVIFPSEALKSPKQASIAPSPPAAALGKKPGTMPLKSALSKDISVRAFPAKTPKPVSLPTTPATPATISASVTERPAAPEAPASAGRPSVKEQAVKPPITTSSLISHPLPVSSSPEPSRHEQETLPIADPVTAKRPAEKNALGSNYAVGADASSGSLEEKEHWATLSYGRFSSFQVIGSEEETRDDFSLDVPAAVRERNPRSKLFFVGASAAALILALGTGAFFMRRNSRKAAFVAASLNPVTTPAPEQPSPVLQPQPAANPPAESVQPPSQPPTTSVNSNNQPSQSSKQVSPKPTAIVASQPKSQAPPASAPAPKPSFKLAPNAAVPQRAPVSRETLPPPAAADEVSASPGTAGISSSIMPDALRNDAEVPPPPPEKIPEKTPEKIGGDVKLPQLLRMVPPYYPLSAKQAGLQGEVTLRANVDTTGKVVGAKVVSGPVLLQQAAVDAVRQWKYAPATLDGKPVSMQVVVKVEFHLN